MPFLRPSRSALFSRIQADFDANLPGTDSRLRRSNTAVLAKVWGLAVDYVYGFLVWIALQLFPSTAAEEFVLRAASLWLSTPRYDAHFASGSVTVTATQVVSITTGTVLQRADGVQFTTSEVVTSTTGTNSIPVVATVAGVSANTTEGTVLTFVTPIGGINSSANVGSGGLTGGTDVESLSSVVNRINRRVQKPPQGGSNDDYVTWALQVPGVTRAWCYPQEMGPGTVTVRFMMDGTYSNGLPLSGDVATVQSYIESMRPSTAKVYVVAPLASPINFTFFSLLPNIPSVQASIKANLADLILREATPGGNYWIGSTTTVGGRLYLSHINEAIQTAAFEIDHLLTSPSANITNSTGYIPTIGIFTW